MQYVLDALNLTPVALGFCIVAVLIGAFVKGYTGFGASMLWATSLSLVLPPLQIVPMVLMFEVATSIHLLPQVWKEVEWRSLWLLLLGTWLATPVGIYALASIPANPIRIGLSVVVFIAAILIWRGFSLKDVPGRPATFGVGLTAGLLNGSMAIVGPPVILFYFSSPVGIAVGRASIVTYFLGTDSVGTAMFASQGLISAEVLWRTVFFLPVLLIGVNLGTRRFLGTTPEAFRKVALILLTALSVALFARAVIL
ncbi:MAG: sulfite exporter TauE/SafE family protein [Gemmatimonadetes bacterium]|nr:sulfite exporter TauE/SafE family protein [Gemmatimonadota bacterium]